MVASCMIKVLKWPKLNDPILIEGLPGIGFIANIVAFHLLQELKAELFAEIRSPAFQDLSVTSHEGGVRGPVNELYYYKGREGEMDVIILYGNTQALTTFGQYELSGRILDIVERLGCRYVVTIGGLRREGVVERPKLYFSASDAEAARDAMSLGAEPLGGGNVFGLAGLLIGLGKLRGLKGFCLLAETSGFHPDAIAAREVLNALCKFLRIKVDVSRLNASAEAIEGILRSFGILRGAIKAELRQLV